jgi:hypothetical protein
MQISPEFNDVLIQAAQTAYVHEAQSLHIGIDEIPMSRRCRTVSAMMLAELQNSGLDTARVETRYGWEVDEHRYVVVPTEDEDVIADPTWLQFVPHESLYTVLPKVLIATREDVVNFVARCGVSKPNQQLWAPRGSHAQPERPLIPAERIARAYDESY